MISERLLEIVVAAVAGSLLTAIVTFYRARAQNNLDQAQAWKTLLEQQQSRVIEQQREIDNLQVEISEKDGYIEKILRILNKAGIEIPTYVFRRRYKTKPEKQD